MLLYIFNKFIIGITFICVPLYLILFFYASFRKIEEWFRIKKIKNNIIGRGVTTDSYERQIMDEKERTRENLFGFLFSDIIIYGTNFILALATIVTMSVSLMSNQSQNRPYVNVKTADIIDRRDTGEIGLRLSIVNNGSITANNVKVSGENFLNDEKMNHYIPESNAIVPPNSIEIYQSLLISGPNVRDYLDPKNKWRAEIYISYDGIGTTGYKTEINFLYNPITKRFEIVGGKAD